MGISPPILESQQEKKMEPESTQSPNKKSTIVDIASSKQGPYFFEAYVNPLEPYMSQCIPISPAI